MVSGASIRILHLADLHLDRPFVGLTPEDARARRRGLREALDRCLELAVERGADVLTIGGDLWEDEHVTPDTCRWVADRLGGAGLPVVLVAGNHDPLRPGGPYQRVTWPENVRVLPAEAGLARHEVDLARHEVGGLERHELGALSIWGMSWGAAPLTARALGGFHVPADGAAHLLLLHGTAGNASFPSAPSRGTAHCPFTGAAVRDAGFGLCLAGHLHAGGVRDGIVVYPGSPEPLAWDETGRHAVALVELAPGAAPRVELIDVNRRRCAQALVDCEGAASSADSERALRAVIAEAASGAAADGARAGLCLRAALRGRIEPGCRIDIEDLAAAAGGGELALLQLRDETQPAFDLDALAAQPTALGAFVRELRERIDACYPGGRGLAGGNSGEEAQRRRLELALDLGLRAMHGDDLAHAR